MMLARAGQTEITWLARCPATLEEFRAVPDRAADAARRAASDEVAFFVSRMLILATSCQDRRLAEYEHIRWWDFIGAP